MSAHKDALVLGDTMKLPRRQFLFLFPAVSRIARAQTYPTRPVRWIVR
jgi:hypothetical protein